MSHRLLVPVMLRIIAGGLGNEYGEYELVAYIAS
jgi:hypothetical protein